MASPSHPGTDAGTSESPPPAVGGYFAQRAFDAAPVAWDFLNDRAFVTGILGPVGSGKSVACCCKIMMLALMQKPDANNVRRSKWIVIRNTYPELRSTTIATWLDTFPEASCGPIVYTHPITHHLKRAPSKIELPTGQTRIEPGFDIQVIFLALDRPGDVRHLKSLEATGAWINEAIEVPVEIFEMLTGRVNRYPKAEEGGATAPVIMMDTNACDDTNWWHDFAEKGLTPDLSKLEIPGAEHLDLSYRFYRQPPAILEVEPSQGDSFRVCESGFPMAEVSVNQVIGSAGRYWAVNPGAENLKYLQPTYYPQQIGGKHLAWLNRFLQAKYVYYSSGKPWLPEYNDQAMMKDLRVDPNLPLLGGIDIGGGTLNPAAVIGQRGPFGDLRILKELSLFDVGVDRFSTELSALISMYFPGMEPPVFTIDPAGKTRDEVFEISVQDHLISRGFKVQLAMTNDPDIRREALALPMGRNMNIQGQLCPGFLVDRSCSTLRAALGGKWAKRRVQSSGGERYEARPEKNKFSHVGDAASYFAMGAGEHRALTRNLSVAQNARGGHESRFPVGGTTVQAQIDFNPFET